ncbi:hypothetical protein GCM10009120_13870 [Sphingobacterium siyangense subsp. cladoniae]
MHILIGIFHKKTIDNFVCSFKIKVNMNRIFLAFTFLLTLVLTDRSLAMQKQANILILIHSDEGGTYEIAKEVAKGIENNGNTKAIIKRVKFIDNPKLNHIPVANVSELSSYDGIAFGSPVYFGNISTAMSEFFAQTTTLWSKHELEGMPAMVFMSAGSGAGRELAMQSFMNMLAVHGMVLVPNGIRGNEKLDKSIPQGNTVLGTTSLASLKNVARPSDGDLNKVKKCVQLVGIFNASEQFSDHAKLMNAASDLTVEIFGDQGKHARATLGASSIPGNSSVEIQAIFEIE